MVSLPTSTVHCLGGGPSFAFFFDCTEVAIRGRDSYGRRARGALRFFMRCGKESERARRRETSRDVDRRRARSWTSLLNGSLCCHFLSDSTTALRQRQGLHNVRARTPSKQRGIAIRSLACSCGPAPAPVCSCTYTRHRQQWHLTTTVVTLPRFLRSVSARRSTLWCS